jgi:hypothetical protein
VQFPDLYFASIVKLAQIVRIEADVKTQAAKPKTIEEVLQQVESEGEPEGRKAFEGFLTKVCLSKPWRRRSLRLLNAPVGHSSRERNNSVI